MRNFFRYLLVLAVLAIGYYGASQHRLTDELQETVETVEWDLPNHSATSFEDSPPIPSMARPTPLAALIDTDRSLTVEAPVDPRATVKNPPEIARPLPQTQPSLADQDPHEYDLLRPKRRPQHALPGEPPRTMAERSAQGINPIGGAKVQQNSDTITWLEDAEWDGSRPTDQPRDVPTLASKQSDSRNFPLPKLAPRPGGRFTVADPIESEPAGDPKQSPGSGEARKLVGQQPQLATGSREECAPFRVTDQPSSLRIHTIEAGDTLSKLAERYLGDRQKVEVIYQANSDVLVDPRLLPIGVDIRIPTKVESDASEDRQTKWASGPEQKNDPLDDLFEEPTRPEEPSNDLEPIPPHALPTFQMNAWQYSGR